jgi:type I restriction enzyme R subunit
MAQGTKEIHFEEHITSYLENEAGYWLISPDSYEKELCLVPNVIISFIQETQPEVYAALFDYYGEKVNEKICQSISKNIQQSKTLDVLRN